MVATSQIVNLVLIGVAVYVGITYGPDIVKWAQDGIDKIKTQAEQNQGTSTPSGDTTTPAPSGDTSTPYVPFTDDSTSSSTPSAPIQLPASTDNVSPQDLTNLQNYLQQLQNTQHPGVSNQDINNLKNFINNAQKKVSKTPELKLSGGPAPIKQTPKTKHRHPAQERRSQGTPITTPTVLPSSHKTIDLGNDKWPDPTHPFESTTPPVTIKKSAPVHPLLKALQPSTPAKPTRRSPATTPSDDKWPDPTHPFESTYPPVTVAKRSTVPSVGGTSQCRCQGRNCCFTGRRCDGSQGQECTNAANTSQGARNTTCTLLRQRFLRNNVCRQAQLQSRFKTDSGFELNPTVVNKPLAEIHPLSPSFSAPGGTKTNAGFAYGDKGQLISLESLSVTIA